MVKKIILLILICTMMGCTTSTPNTRQKLASGNFHAYDPIDFTSDVKEKKTSIKKEAGKALAKAAVGAAGVTMAVPVIMGTAMSLGNVDLPPGAAVAGEIWDGFHRHEDPRPFGLMDTE